MGFKIWPVFLGFRFLAYYRLKRLLSFMMYMFVFTMHRGGIYHFSVWWIHCSVAIVNPLDWKLVHPTFLQCTEGPLVTFKYILRNFTSLSNDYVCSTKIIKIEIQCSDVMSWFLFNPGKKNLDICRWHFF